MNLRTAHHLRDNCRSKYTRQTDLGPLQPLILKILKIRAPLAMPKDSAHGKIHSFIYTRAAHLLKVRAQKVATLTQINAHHTV